ncbi:hypothetical protein G7054_g11731 [Neopestalotiopsis clavispora]|nr:hypothetical protein G7054_g11731 [Neopestalotiopsis clavispora]
MAHSLRQRARNERILRPTRNSGVQKSTAASISERRQTRTRRVEGLCTEAEAQAKPAPKRASKKATPLYLQRSEADAQADPNQGTALFVLPGEILHAIASHLPPASVICLTLTCKLALHSLGTSSWGDGRIRQRRHWDSEMRMHHRASLIELLSRDLRDLDMAQCDRCFTIHGPLKRPRDHRETKLTKPCWGQNAIIDYYPKSELEGYSLVWEHIRHALEISSVDTDSSIEYLSGSFQVQHPSLHYTLSTSGSRVDGNLVIRHDYRFRALSAKVQLTAGQILGMPMRICPHQSTLTVPLSSARWSKPNKQFLNGPLFTQSIASAFPVAQKTGVPAPKLFRKPTPIEERMLESLEAGEDTHMSCRFCSTKWAARYAEKRSSGKGKSGELTVTVWHCFYKELYMAAKVWPWLVWRGASNLGKAKMNTEFSSQSRSFPDFRIE